MTAVYDLRNGIVPLRLEHEVEELVSSGALEQHGRSARLLMEDGDLHVLMVALAPGAGMPEHSVEGPALVQALRGDLVLRAGDEEWTLGPGGILSIAPSLAHSVETSGGCVILVVVQSAAELRLFSSEPPASRNHS